MPSTAPEGHIHIAVGIIPGEPGKVLVAQRPPGKDQAGKWEFPGGKVRPGEDTFAALRRELEEELGIIVKSARPLIKIRHSYIQERVFLDVRCLTGYQGQPTGREGQNIRWAGLEELEKIDLLAADRPIVHALRLPLLYAITAADRYGKEGMVEKLEQALDAGLRLVQLREKRMASHELQDYCGRIVTLCHDYGAQVLINGDPALMKKTDADGVHLDSASLNRLSARPLPQDLWVAASCHDAEELARAARIGVDFAVLSPVQVTPSHPRAKPLGWSRFRALCGSADFPIYALGGLMPADLATGREAGAQGLAMISGLWEAPSISAAVESVEGLDLALHSRG